MIKAVFKNVRSFYTNEKGNHEAFEVKFWTFLTHLTLLYGRVSLYSPSLPLQMPVLRKHVIIRSLSRGGGGCNLWPVRRMRPPLSWATLLHCPILHEHGPVASVTSWQSSVSITCPLPGCWGEFLPYVLPVRLLLCTDRLHSRDFTCPTIDSVCPLSSSWTPQSSHTKVLSLMNLTFVPLRFSFVFLLSRIYTAKHLLFFFFVPEWDSCSPLLPSHNLPNLQLAHCPPSSQPTREDSGSLQIPPPSSNLFFSWAEPDPSPVSSLPGYLQPHLTQ